MPHFVADCDLPGVTLEDLRRAQRRLEEVGRRSIVTGTPVRYIRSLWLPADWRVLWLYEADDASAVEAVSRAAQIPYLRVIEAVDLTPVGLGGEDLDHHREES